MMMLYTKRLGFFTAFYMQTSVTFPYLVLAPSYFKGEITLGTMFMLFRALGSVKGAFDWIISSYGTLTDFRATADRLQNFTTLINTRTKLSDVALLTSPPPKPWLPGSSSPALIAQDMTVALPACAGGQTLWKKANLVVQKGEFVLLTAPEGSGKSCFFRALARIWPHASGNVYLPEGALFVPQKAHIPQGSLKQALTYPESQDRFTDSEVHAALEAVGLAAVLRNRELSEEANWQLTLSGGEQQRLAIAHAVLRRPPVLFLDEATGAMGDQGALELYELLKRPGTLPDGASVISISHDIDLLKPVHDSHYSYNASKGEWIEA
jgi:putative ATP-binding cassette transporter